MGDFFISFNQATQALTETVFVHFVEGIFIPQTAAICLELIAQHHFALEQTNLQL